MYEEAVHQVVLVRLEWDPEEGLEGAVSVRREIGHKSVHRLSLGNKLC